MRSPRASTKKPPRSKPSSLAEAEQVAESLAAALRRVVESPARLPSGASALAARLKFNRVLISRIQNALKCDSALEALHRLPGPESLRTFVEGMRRNGVAAARADDAMEAIDRFNALINTVFGTRGKLNAAICSHAPSMRLRHELESRHRIFSGMRELRGGEASAWVATHMLAPSSDDPSKLDARVLQGFIGLRQLRTDIAVYFDFVPAEATGRLKADRSGPGELEEFYTNPPAKLEIDDAGGRRVVRLAPGHIGKDFVCDMLSLSRVAGAALRFAKAPGRRNGSFALMKTAVKLLHLDIVIADGLVDDSAPELFVFAPGPRSCTNVNDRIDDLDRVVVPEQVEVLASGPDRFEVPAVPNYRRMLEKMAAELGQDLDTMHVHRVSVAYPPFGYEFVSTFRLRSAP